MKILIIEDEFRNYNRLRRMLTAYDPAMTIEGPLESVSEARQWLAAHQGTAAPDLVFADIRLSDGISFDALDTLDDATSLVFTTAYDEYALKAFQYNGLAYLMKPIEEGELYQTLDRILKLHGNNRQGKSSDMQGLKEIVAQMRIDNYQYRERFLIPYKDGFEIVNVNDVSFICTEHRDTRVYLRSGKFYSLSMSLDELERQLNPHHFFRANRQYIIHIDSVNGIKIYFAGKLRILLRGYENIDVMCSRERAPQLKEWLNK